MDKFFSTYQIDDRSLVAFIKREIHNLAVNNGFSTHRAAEVDIIVSELTSNLIKYAERGELLYRIHAGENGTEIQIYCIDNGAGIDNLQRIMNDGFSTANTLGQGLGAIKRLSNEFQIFSIRNWGTVQYIRIANTTQDMPERKTLDFAAIQVCLPGEVVCGDGYHVKYTTGGFQIFVGDGLGHGANANIAVEEAIKAFRICREKDPAEIIRDIHSSVRKTRGLVATIATVDYKSAQWTICGVGNISTRIFNGVESKTYTPYNGIVGHNIPRTINNTIVPYEKHQTIVMHSDGVKNRWNLSDLQSIMKYEPEMIAAALYKDQMRGTDDATVFVGKIK